RLRMSSWCLTASDSATTAPRPPGLASRARVTSKWAIKLNSKLIKANFNRVRTIHKSALQQCFPPESAIRHTQLRQLTQEHRQRDAVHVAVADRFREELGHEAEPREARRDTHDA